MLVLGARPSTSTAVLVTTTATSGIIGPHIVHLLGHGVDRHIGLTGLLLRTGRWQLGHSSSDGGGGGRGSVGSRTATRSTRGRAVVHGHSRSGCSHWDSRDDAAAPLGCHRCSWRVDRFSNGGLRLDRRGRGFLSARSSISASWLAGDLITDGQLRGRLRTRCSAGRTRTLLR